MGGVAVGRVLGAMGRRGWCRSWGYWVGRVLGRRALPRLGRRCGCWVWGIVECCVVSSLASNSSTCTIYRNTIVPVIDTPSYRSYLLYCALYRHLCVRYKRTDDTIDTKDGSIPGADSTRSIRDRSEEDCVISKELRYYLDFR